MNGKHLYNTCILGVLHYIDDEIGEFIKCVKNKFCNAIWSKDRVSLLRGPGSGSLGPSLGVTISERTPAVSCELV